MRISLIISLAILLSTSLLAESLGKGKIKTSISLGYKMAVTEHWNVHQFNIASNSVFSFLSSNESGLYLSYGITDFMEMTYSMPVYGMQIISGADVGVPIPNFGLLHSDTVDLTRNHTLGSPLLGITYYKDLGYLGLRVAPYLGVPFFERSVLKADIVVGETELNEKDETNLDFEQQTLLGISMAIDSNIKGKIFWQNWFNIQVGFAGDEDISLTTILSGLLGYKLSSESITKLQLYLVTPDLMNDEKGALELVDSKLKILALYGMKLDKYSGFNLSVNTELGFTEKAKQTELLEKASFVATFTFDYWMIF